jgi:hypothetical protein
MEATKPKAKGRPKAHQPAPIKPNKEPKPKKDVTPALKHTTEPKTRGRPKKDVTIAIKAVRATKAKTPKIKHIGSEFDRKAEEDKQRLKLAFLKAEQMYINALNPN